MRYLLLLPLMLLSLSFKNVEIEPTWVGTIQVFYLPDTDEFLVQYDGNFHRCVTKAIIDRFYSDCDSINEVNFKEEPEIDSVEISKKPIKTTRI